MTEKVHFGVRKLGNDLMVISRLIKNCSKRFLDLPNSEIKDRIGRDLSVLSRDGKITWEDYILLLDSFKM